MITDLLRGVARFPPIFRYLPVCRQRAPLGFIWLGAAVAFAIVSDVMLWKKKSFSAYPENN